MSSVGSLNWVDFTIIAVVVLSTIISIIRGFAREAVSLVSWVTAVVLGLYFAQPFANVLPSFISKPSLRLTIAFGIIFVVTLLVGALVGYLVSHLVEKTRLTGMNRLLGIAFGIFRGLLLIALVLLAATLTDAPNSKAWKESVLIPKFEPVVSWVQSFLPDAVNKYFPQPKKDLDTTNDEKTSTATDTDTQTDSNNNTSSDAGASASSSPSVDAAQSAAESTAASSNAATASNSNNNDIGYYNY